MPIAQSKLTTQGQVSVPAEVRRRLGLEPGAVLEWDDQGADAGTLVVRRAARYSSADVHRALFGKTEPEAKTLEQLRSALSVHARRRHARR